MRRAVQSRAVDRLNEAEASSREAVMDYLAELSGDMAKLARQHGLHTLGYILEMARLEAENARSGGS